MSVPNAPPKGFLSGVASLVSGNPASISSSVRNLIGPGSVGLALAPSGQPKGVWGDRPLAARVVAAQQPQQQQPQQQQPQQQQPQQQQPQPQHDEQDLEQPEPPIPLDTLQKLQAYLNSCPPGLTELALDGCQIKSVAGVIFPSGLLDLDLGGNQITSLSGVQFPDGLTGLSLFGNQITSFKGVRFPPNLLDLNLDGNQIITLRGVQFPPSLLELSITDTKINSFAGFQIPPNLLSLHLSDNEITSLQGVQFPPRLTLLNLENNKIKSFQGVQFPIGLLRLILSFNEITSLTGVKFPPSLTELRLENNQISPLSIWGSPFEGVIFPPSLLRLNLSNNNCQTLYRLQFPPNLTSLNLEGNPLRSLKGIINPNEYVMEYLKHNFPSLYFRDLHTQHKGAKLAEKSASKAARQSQKATLKKMTDLSQHSMQIQLRAVTSFLREGMAARAQQHADQMLRDKQDKPTTYEESLFYAKLGEKTYPIPMNEELLVQDVLDYLNEHYYISVLHNCDGMHLHKPGMGNLDSGRTLKDCGVVSEEALDLVCGTRTHQGGFARHHHSRKCNKQYQTRRNKSKSKSKSKPKKNGHGRN